MNWIDYTLLALAFVSGGVLIHMGEGGRILEVLNLVLGLFFS